MNRIVCITGATSGIGMATARRFAAAGDHLIITGRRADRLATLAAELTSAYQVRIHQACFDIQSREEVFAAVDGIPDDFKSVNILVNNAGLALGRDSFEDANLDDWEQMLHTNVEGLLYMSKALLPALKSASQPHIINIGSIAGKEVYENGNVYCASKFAVDAITKSMRIDLLKYGIKVTGIHPGAVETEFSLVRYNWDESKANAAYQGFVPLTPEDVADTILYCASLPAHMCINELVITPLQQAGTYYFFKEK